MTHARDGGKCDDVAAKTGVCLKGDESGHNGESSYLHIMPIIRCAMPAEAQAAFGRIREQMSSGLFLFFGSEDPGTGMSWCPDCVTADPVLRAACMRLRPELPLIECPVGLRSDWKGNADHPYRIDPNFRIARIPTLLLFVGGLERGRLVEADCAQVSQVEAFLAR